MYTYLMVNLLHQRLSYEDFYIKCTGNFAGLGFDVALNLLHWTASCSSMELGGVFKSPRSVVI